MEWVEKIWEDYLGSISDLKITGIELEKMNKPLGLDLTAYFNLLQETILKSIKGNKTPDQIINEINSLFAPTNDNTQVMKDDRPIDFVDFHGINIGIENPKGSVRTGVDPDGNEWSIDMNFDYGFIKNANAIDGDSLDAYIGDDKDSEKVFVVNQQDPVTGEFDEYKVMFGFDTRQKAVAGYLSQYDSPLFFGGITEETLDTFRVDIGVAKAGKKYDVGDTKTRPDGTTWEKTGTYSWKKISGQGAVPQSTGGTGAPTPDKKKPTTKPSKDDDTSDPKYMSAEDASKLIDKNGKKGFWNLTKSGLNNYLKAHDLDPSKMTHAEKKEALELFVDADKAKDKEENTIAPKAFKPFSNENLKSNDFDEEELQEKYDDIDTPVRGGHWGSASTHNSTAVGVAFTSGTNWRPINKMEDGKLVDFNQNVDNNAIVNGMRLRKYAQGRMKQHPISEVPNFHRGMTIDEDAFNQLISGESDTIELTGCTAFSSYEDIAKRYSKSSWTQSFGSGRKSIRIILERDNHVDDSIGMWHEAHRSTVNDPKPAFELLSGLEAIRVIGIKDKKSVTQPETFKKRAKVVSDNVGAQMDTKLKYDEKQLESEKKALKQMEDDTYDYPSWYSDTRKKQAKEWTKGNIEAYSGYINNFDADKKNFTDTINSQYEYLGKLANEDNSWIDRGLKIVEDTNDWADMTITEMLGYEGSQDMSSPYNIFSHGTWSNVTNTFKNPPDEIGNMKIPEYRRFIKTMDQYNSAVSSGKRIKNQFKQKSAGVTVVHCVAGRGKKAIQGGSDESMGEET